METIKILRMKSGYDLIGFVSEDLTHQVHIKKPMKISITVDPRDQQQFFVIQNWLPHQYFAKDEVDIWRVLHSLGLGYRWNREIRNLMYERGLEHGERSFQKKLKNLLDI
jgi:hypothetical protein